MDDLGIVAREQDLGVADSVPVRAGEASYQEVALVDHATFIAADRLDVSGDGRAGEIPQRHVIGHPGAQDCPALQQ